MIQTEIFKNQNLLQFLAPLYVAMPLSRQLQDLLKRYQVELSDQELTDHLYKSIIRHLRTEGRKAIKASLIKYLLEELDVYEDTENLPPRNIEELLTARASLLFSDDRESEAFVAMCNNDMGYMDEDADPEDTYLWSELERTICDYAPADTTFRCTMGFYRQDGTPAIEVTLPHLEQAAQFLLDYARDYEGDTIIIGKTEL